MRILHTTNALESPFEEAPRAESIVVGGSADYYGACSLETFCDAGGLTYTHDDAYGWLDYLDQFVSVNFWRGDGSVQPWIYYEDYDNWEDTYGADAVMAFYHSGHGGMRSDGIFEVPVGADWGGLGCRVFSNQMRLGNEQVRYIFFSTCESLRVLGGHSPTRTWSPANLGFRMLFGYETVSWDNPGYGRYFWEEWKKGKSFSTAWLDASWYHVATDQAPSVVAVGATQAEAQDRLYNERSFSFSGVSTNWWSWRWYNAARGASATREPNRALPRDLVVARLRPVEVSDRAVRETVDRMGLDLPLPEEVGASPDGAFRVGEGDAQIAFGSDGSFEARMAQPNLENRDQIPLRQARSAADEAISRHGLGEQAELIFDCVRLASAASASADGSEVVEPSVTETTVQYKQVINGLPVVTPHAGSVSVTIDNDGTVTGVRSSVRQIEQLVQPLDTTTSPPEPGYPAEEQIARPRATDAAGYEQLLAQEWGRRVASTWAIRGEMPLGFSDVPGSTEVGYDIRGNTAGIIARKAIEVDFGGVLRKRYWVSVPLLQ
jgi:hypothetical protein